MLIMHRQGRRAGHRRGIIPPLPATTAVRVVRLVFGYCELFTILTSQPHHKRSRSTSISSLSTVTPTSRPHAGPHSQRAHDHANTPEDTAGPPRAARGPDNHSNEPRKLNATTHQGSETIVAFLRTLPQDLSSLLPVFLQHGVDDSEALRGMLHMPAWRSWLYSWVKEGWLTELQFRMVCDGLVQIALGWAVGG